MSLPSTDIKTVYPSFLENVLMVGMTILNLLRAAEPMPAGQASHVQIYLSFLNKNFIKQLLRVSELHQMVTSSVLSIIIN